MINKEDFIEIRRIVAEELNPQIEKIVHRRIDKLEDQLKKVELIYGIIKDIKELFKNE